MGRNSSLNSGSGFSADQDGPNTESYTDWPPRKLRNGLKQASKPLDGRSVKGCPLKRNIPLLEEKHILRLLYSGRLSASFPCTTGIIQLKRQVSVSISHLFFLPLVLK